eukprot:CAMPEP_0184644848 /NCGR_PEP_ID=MMETSP0308-20130426/1473_1 /TAXON_ID=38269 /ORGANISM="Gloeochaete witrockiana, Strain SAG 46.84" /LENGTH=395 /DNA_ID=CAMNT_0027073571 /DNA_START=103 /DNA_END=1287 /DNA_ORIENTATION=-
MKAQSSRLSWKLRTDWIVYIFVALCCTLYVCYHSESVMEMNTSLVMEACSKQGDGSRLNFAQVATAQRTSESEQSSLIITKSRPWDDHGQCKIRVIDLDPKFHVDVFQAYAAAVPLEKRQHGQEYYVHQALLRSSVLTTNNDEADLFLVPYYASCRDVLCKWFNKSCGFTPLVAKDITPHTAWSKYEGRNFAFMSGHTLGFTDRKLLANSMKVVNDFTCANFWDLSVVDLRRDIILPYPVAFPEWMITPDGRPDPPPARDILAFFTGAVFRWRTTRMRLRKEIENEPGVMFNAVRNVGSQKNHSDYSMYLMRSVFCLAIEGDCPATKRVFESIVAGCIPVILADDIILPFEDRFKWDEFAVFFNTNTTGKEILTKLREMPSFEIQSRQRALAEIW